MWTGNVERGTNRRRLVLGVEAREPGHSGPNQTVSMDLNSASTVVLQVLTQATSQDTAVLKPAEEQLKQWETQPGFYSVLLNIFTNHSLDINVRWLAVLYFKNGIDRYWRRVAPHALSEEEKSTLRAGLITNFNEPINQIATQIAVLIAKLLGWTALGSGLN